MALGPRHDRMMSATLIFGLAGLDGGGSLHVFKYDGFEAGGKGGVSALRFRSGNIGHLSFATDLPITGIGVYVYQVSSSSLSFGWW